MTRPEGPPSCVASSAEALTQGCRASEELSRLEVRVNARFSAVGARFSTVDRRLVAVVNRIEDANQAAFALGSRCDARFRWTDDRLDATDVRVELHQEQVTAQLAKLRRTLRRAIVLAAVGTGSGWAAALSSWWL